MPPLPTPDQSDHSGKQRNLPLEKSGSAILGTQTFGSPPPPPPPRLILPGGIARGLYRTRPPTPAPSHKQEFLRYLLRPLASVRAHTAAYKTSLGVSPPLLASLHAFLTPSLTHGDGCVPQQRNLTPPSPPAGTPGRSAGLTQRHTNPQIANDTTENTRVSRILRTRESWALFGAPQTDGCAASPLLTGGVGGNHQQHHG